MSAERPVKPKAASQNDSNRSNSGHILKFLVNRHGFSRHSRAVDWTSPTPPESSQLKSGFGRTVGQSFGANRLAAIAPTLVPSGCLNSKSEICVPCEHSSIRLGVLRSPVESTVDCGPSLIDCSRARSRRKDWRSSRSAMHGARTIRAILFRTAWFEDHR